MGSPLEGGGPFAGGPSPDAAKVFMDNAKSAELLREERERVLQESVGLRELMVDIKRLDLVQDVVERKELERKIRSGYDKVFFSALEHPLLVADENLRFRNSLATWVSHPGRGFLDSVITMLKDEDHILTTEKEEGITHSKEREAWTKRMFADFVWMRGNFAMQEGIGHIMKYYFSGPDQMLNTLYEQRQNMTSEEFINTFQKVVRDLTLAPNEAALAFRFREKIKEVEDVTKAAAEIKFKEKDGIRETAVRMQNDRFHNCVAIAEIGQINWDKTVFLPNGEIDMDKTLAAQDFEMKLNADEVFVLKALVGIGTAKFDVKLANGATKKIEVPKEVLSWFTITDTHDNKEEYKALMEALVLEDARNRITEAGKLSGDEKTGILEQIIKDVRKRTGDLNGKKLGLTLEEKLARNIVKGGIATDLAFGFSLKLGWAYNHSEGYYSITKSGFKKRLKGVTTDAEFEDLKKKYPKGRFISGKRDVTFAGIYTGLDTYTTGWPFHHDRTYDARASKRSGLVPPTDAYYRNFADQFPPTKTPDLLWGPNGIVNRDPRLAKSIGRLFGNTPEGKRWQEEHKIRLKPQDAKILAKMLWGWGTGWESDQIKGYDYAGTGAESKQAFFVLAIPQEIGIMNFLQTIKLEGHKDAFGNSLTLWEEMTKQGIGPDGNLTDGPVDWSDIKWGDMKVDAFDRWHVDLNMLGRVISPLVDPLKKDFVDQFFSSEGQLKELLKRLYLGLRDETIKVEIPVGDPKDGKTELVQVPGPLLWCSFASTLIAWYIADSKKLTTRFFNTNKETFVDDKDGGSLNAWLKNEFWMPGDIPDFDKFSDTLTLMTFFAAEQMYYISGDDKGGGGENKVLDWAAGLTESLPKDAKVVSRLERKSKAPRPPLE